MTQQRVQQIVKSGEWVVSKVIRWHCAGVTPNAENGNFVALEDYESLQAALREALDQWDKWNHSELEGTRGWLGNGKKHNARIAELRAQFLDDK